MTNGLSVAVDDRRTCFPFLLYYDSKRLMLILSASLCLLSSSTNTIFNLAFFRQGLLDQRFVERKIFFIERKVNRKVNFSTFPSVTCIWRLIVYKSTAKYCTE